MKTGHVWRAILLAITLLAFVLRIYRLDGQSLWYDEGFSIYLAQKSVAEISARTAADIQPPLYYYILHAWLLLAGQSEFAARFVSVFFGTLTTPLAFLLTRRLLDARVGLLAALLLAISPFHVWYAQEARMYTLVTLLGILSSWLLLVAIGHAAGRGDAFNSGAQDHEGPAMIPHSDGNSSRRARRSYWLLYAAASIMAVYTHYYAFFLLAVQAIFLVIWWAANRKATNTLASGLFAQLATVVAYLPWASFALNRYAVDESYWQGALSLDFVRKTVLAFATGHTVYESQAQVIALGYVLLVLIGVAAVALPVARRRTGNGVALLFLLLYLLLPFALLYLLSVFRPKFNPRYLMLASPPFFVLAAAGIESMRRARLALPLRLTAHLQRSKAARLLALCGLLYVVLTSSYALANNYGNRVYVRDDFRSVAAYVARSRQPDEAIVLCSGHLFPVFNYYLISDGVYRIPDQETLSTRAVVTYEVAARLNEIAAGHGGLWLVLWQNEVVDPNGILTGLLDAQAERLPVDSTFWGVELRHYRLPAGVTFAKPVIAHATAINFGNRLTLLGYNQDGDVIPSGQVLPLTLFWQAQQPLDEDYWLSLRLVDPARHVFGRQDQRPASYTYPTMRWQAGTVIPGRTSLPILPGTPPGSYNLEASIFVPARSQNLDILDASGAPAGARAVVGTVVVGEPATPPAIASLGMARETQVTLAPGLELMGTSRVEQAVRQGEVVSIELFWRKTSQVSDDYRLVLRLVTPDGRVLTENPSALTGTPYPTGAWPAGSVVRGVYEAVVPADAPPQVQVQAGLLDGKGASAGTRYLLAELAVSPVTRITAVPTMQHPQMARFGDLATLLGYDISSTAVRPGQILDLTLYWQAGRNSAPGRPYTVFTHLLGADQRIYGQHDGTPADGARPTTSWVEGEIIVDRHRLTVRDDAAAGDYILEIGLYDPASLQRLLLVDEQGNSGDDHLLLITPMRVLP